MGGISMKPFNLEKALAGEPVITRNGRKITEIVIFKTLEEGVNQYPIIAVIDGRRESYSLEGRYMYNGPDSPADLLMGPNIKTGYVNIFKGGISGVFACTEVFDTPEKAAKHVEQCKQLSGTAKHLLTQTITWEE